MWTLRLFSTFLLLFSWQTQAAEKKTYYEFSKDKLIRLEFDQPQGKLIFAIRHSYDEDSWKEVHKSALSMMNESSLFEKQSKDDTRISLKNIYIIRPTTDISFILISIVTNDDVFRIYRIEKYLPGCYEPNYQNTLQLEKYDFKEKKWKSPIVHVTDQPISDFAIFYGENGDLMLSTTHQEYGISCKRNLSLVPACEVKRLLLLKHIEALWPQFLPLCENIRLDPDNFFSIFGNFPLELLHGIFFILISLDYSDGKCPF